MINAQTRKDKRWAVMCKPSALMINKNVSLPIINPTTWNIDEALEAVSEGSTTITLKGNYEALCKLNYPYKFYTSVVSDAPEILNFTAVTYNPTTGLTQFTLSDPVTRSYEVGSRIVGGALATTLVVAVNSGDSELSLEDSLGLSSDMYLVIGSGDTMEVVYVTLVSGSIIKIQDPLYFNHAAQEPVKELDGKKYLETASQLVYNITFDTIYGKLPGSGVATYAQVGGGNKNPWVQVDEKASFSEAKKRAIYYAKTLGTANVRIVRVVDTWDVLYPIS